VIAAIAAIEALLHEDVGRNISALAAATRGGLLAAAQSLAGSTAPRVGVITGFYVPKGTPPAAETDGPVGAALLLRGLTDAGIQGRLATDALCAPACGAALLAAGLGDMPIDQGPVAASIAAWQVSGITHALAIERCGPGADGIVRNLRGENVSDVTAPLDQLYLAGSWTRLAIGDGGNEIGMGSLPAALIAGAVKNGARIACRTPADHLIVAGVSNWGAWGLLAALALLRADWRAAMLGALDPVLDAAVLRATVANGPAVDGVTRLAGLTVDGMEASVHRAKLIAIRAIATV
jgi:hypothetical protein